MNKTISLILAFLFVLICAISLQPAVAGTETEPLPDVTLKVPENKDHIKYLGLKQEPGSEFNLSQIDADVLMIELFSMYCPYCQNAAPKVNKLYEMMEQNKREDMKLVIIGIGANNTDLEVETFRKGFDIRFPLFSDPDLSIYKTLAGAGTPTFIGCKKDKENNSLIFFRKSGGFIDPAEFLDDLLKRSGHR